MAGPERDDVDMDIDEVLGLIAPKGCVPKATSQLPTHPAPTSPKTASQPLDVQTVAVLGSLASSKAETETPEAPTAAKKVPLPSEAALGGALGADEDDDMYDPLAGDDLPLPALRVGLANSERGNPAEHFNEGGASALPNGERIAVKSSGLSAARQGAACPTLEVAEKAASESTGAMHQAQAENLGMKTKRRSDAAAPETATALLGLLEQYSDEESDPEEPGQVMGKPKQVSGEPRQVSGEEGRSPAAQKADAEGTTQNARGTEKGHSFPKSAISERATGVREDFLDERDGKARTSADRRNAENERDGGNARDLKGRGREGNEGLGASGHSTEPESTSGFDHGYRDQRKRDEGRRERERPGDSHERRKDRNWGGGDPDRHKREGRAGWERKHEGGRVRNRDMGDRRAHERDDAALRGVHRNPRERGGHTEGRRADRRGDDRDRNRQDGFREKNRSRAPPEERPGSKAALGARGADSVKKPDSKPGAMAGSTGADVDLSAAVAQAAAAAARSAKLAASRAPPPAPADPAEAAAKAAEMVNKTLMIQNAVLQQKRKMLWGDKKVAPEEAAGGGTNRWDAVAVGDSERTHKFQKLMFLSVFLLATHTGPQGRRPAVPTKGGGGASCHDRGKAAANAGGIGTSVCSWAAAEGWAHGRSWFVSSLLECTSVLRWRRQVRFVHRTILAMSWSFCMVSGKVKARMGHAKKDKSRFMFKSVVYLHALLSLFEVVREGQRERPSW